MLAAIFFCRFVINVESTKFLKNNLKKRVPGKVDLYHSCYNHRCILQLYYTSLVITQTIREQQLREEYVGTLIKLTANQKI